MRSIDGTRTFRNLAGRGFLIGVGAQKAGTSWLYDYLGHHPEVAMSPIKELHYFDQRFRPDLCGRWAQDFERQTSAAIGALARGKTGSLSHLQHLSDRVRMNVDPAAYLEYFDRLATHGRPVMGEVTPSYSLLPEQGFAEMRSMIIRAGAEPRIVFILRDPAERFWSQCRFESSADRSIEAIYSQALGDPQFLERTRYDATMARLRAVFRPQELLVLFYEDLFAKPAIERLCRFLGIAFAPPDATQRINASPQGSLVADKRKHLMEVFAPVYAFVEREFGAEVPSIWRQGLKADRDRTQDGR